MQTVSLHSLHLPTRPFSGNLPSRKVVPNQRKRSSMVVVLASRRGGDYNGKVVDENMIVLRKRIHEMKVAERSDYVEEPPHDWMEWEKNYVGGGCYDKDVCDAMSWLQSWLMETRPCLALGMAVLVLLSAMVPMVVVVFHLM